MNELSMLALYGLVLIAVLVVQVLLALPQVGLGYLASARDDARPLRGAAARAERCLANSVVAMVLFAPPVLILAVTDRLGALSMPACQIFVAARVLYALFYWFGIAWLRTLVWAAGLLMTLVLYLLAL